MIQLSVVTCPQCRSTKEEEMPLYFLQRFYLCAACGVESAAGDDDCCVFCAFGNIVCPTGQDKRNCCSG